MSGLIAPAAAGDLEEVKALLQEYAVTLPGHDLYAHGFVEELAGLPGAYAPPRGRLLLARVEGVAAGCVALRRLGPELGELKRLYVRPRWRGRGLGRELIAAVLAEARQEGYRRVCLDTLPAMTAALALYTAFGFRPAARYLEDHAEGALCLELALT